MHCSENTIIFSSHFIEGAGESGLSYSNTQILDINILISLLLQHDERQQHKTERERN